MQDQALADSYDEMPYESLPLTFAHPSRTAALAKMRGIDPGPVRTARVLELGCASGGNLIGLASAMPAARFTGVDLSPRQIADARRAAETLALTNIEFHALNLRDLPDDVGPFDFIIAHGLYSWVPPDVQEKLLSICGRRLAPRGIAMISFNTYPGWFARGAIRELLLQHVPHDASPAERVAVARRVLDSMNGWFAAANSLWAQWIREELAAAPTWADHYLLHEYLTGENRPLYFHEFVARASEHGLRYVWEVEPRHVAPQQFPPEVAAALTAQSADPIALEQTIDVLRGCPFRRALLCRADAGPVDRAPLTYARLANLHVASPNKPAAGDRGGSAGEFTYGAGGRMVVHDAPTRALLTRLGTSWPRAVAVEELRRESGMPPDALAKVLSGMLMHGAAEFYAEPPAFTLQPGDRPRASGLARYEAASGAPGVTNLRHEAIEFQAEYLQLLPLFDGRLTRDELVEQLAAEVEGTGMAPAGHTAATLRGGLRATVDAAVAALAINAVMVE